MRAMTALIFSDNFSHLHTQFDTTVRKNTSAIALSKGENRKRAISHFEIFFQFYSAITLLFRENFHIFAWRFKKSSATDILFIRKGYFD